MADETKDVISSGAGLAAVLAAEGALDTADAVVARGYWEQVWRRLRRDKVALAGGVFIIFLFIAAYIGAPIAAHILGHGPDDQFAGALDPKTLLPVGPWTHVSTIPYVGAVGSIRTRCSCSAVTASWAATSSCACSTARRRRWRWRSARPS
jgi:hypothetical protein